MRNDLGSGAPFGFSEPRTISTAGGAVSFSPETVLGGSENTSSTPSPTWRAARSETATGTNGDGGTGSPGAPQPETMMIMEIRKGKTRAACVELSERRAQVPFLFSIFRFLVHRM